MNPEPASTLLLLKDINLSIEVFMIKRASKTNFGGTWVFPGGKIDKEDLDSETLNLCQGLDDKKASLILNIKSNGLSYWVACLRECFEESGVPLAYREDGSDFNPNDEESNLLNILRDSLNNGKIGFANVLREFNLKGPYSILFNLEIFNFKYDIIFRISLFFPSSKVNFNLVVFFCS